MLDSRNFPEHQINVNVLSQMLALASAKWPKEKKNRAHYFLILKFPLSAGLPQAVVTDASFRKVCCQCCSGPGLKEEPNIQG